MNAQPNGHAPSSRWGAAQSQEVRSVNQVQQKAAASDDEDVEIVYEEVEVEDGEEEGEYEEVIEEEEEVSHRQNASQGQHHMTTQQHAAHLQEMRSQRSMSITEKDIEQVEPYMRAHLTHDMSDGDMSHQMSQTSMRKTISSSTKIVTHQTSSSSVQQSYSVKSGGMISSQFESEEEHEFWM